MSPENENRPGTHPERLPESHAATTYILADLDDMAATIGGAFAVVVEIHPGRYRRKVYLSLRGAENAARRARERGQSVRIVMAQLAPLYVLSGTAQPELCNDGQTTKAARTEVVETLRPGPTHSLGTSKEGQA